MASCDEALLRNQNKRLILLSRLKYWCAAFLLLGASGCSTTNHPPVVAEYYGDLTSHYNAYFNAKEKLKGVFVAVDKTHKDNYKEVIALHTYADPKETGSFSSELDEVEKKSTTSVQIHKYSNYVDDHFLLMGKASYLKGDYEKAAGFLKYTTTEFKDGVDYVKERRKNGLTATPNKRKKKATKPKFIQVLDEKQNLVLQKIDERPHYQLFIHEPARAEALIWLAKTYTAQAKYAEAATVLQYARSDDKFYKNLDPQVELADADNQLRQKNYHAAIEPLEKYIGMVKGKKKRIRPYFILAQIYELEGNYTKAGDYYKRALKSNPNYDMEFYAKIKRANLGRKSKQGTDEIKKLLASMTHDGKYRDYLDQIYYELGEIALNENDRTQARKYFHKSVASSTKNQEQLAASFLQLARMDYEDEVYVSSKNYYDSTITAMAKNDTAYAGVEARNRMLTRLVAQLTVISQEDSLQRIARMPKAERDKFLKKLQAEKEKEAERREQEKSASKGAATTDFAKGGANPLPGVTQGGDNNEPTWYFYNPTLRSSGYNDFIKRWGRRKLEDNWRRKDKSSSAPDASADDAKKDSTAANGTDEIADQSIEKLAAGLPLTPEKMKVSDEKMAEAYYTAGTIYKDDLKNYRKATAMFEELNKKYSDHKFKLETLYQLYLLAQNNRNTPKAEGYKATILNDYPNSVIAQYLKDPGYLDQLKKKETAIEDYYASAYSDYASGQYASAEEKIKMADVRFNPNSLKAKFDLLQVMILGKQNRLDDYIQALNKLISKLPPSLEKEVATKLLANLNASKLPQIDLSKQKPDTAAIGQTDTSHVALPSATTTTIATVSDTAKKIQPVAIVADTAKKLAESKTEAAKESVTVPEKKPLSRAERLDSIMRAEKAAKNKPQSVAVEPASTNKPPVNFSKPDSAASKEASKPVAATANNNITLPKDPAARQKFVDSLRTARNQQTAPSAATTTNATNNITLPKDPVARQKFVDSLRTARNQQTTPSAATTTNATNNITLPKDPIARQKFVDSLKRARGVDTTAKKVVVKPESGVGKSVAAVKDSLQRKARLDSLGRKRTLDSLQRKHVMDSLQRKKTADSLALKKAVKPLAKDTAKKVAADTLKKSAPIVLPVFDADTTTAIYGLSDNAPHAVIIFCRDPAALTPTLSSKLENAISKMKDPPLSVRSVMVDGSFRLINIKPVQDKAAAMALIHDIASATGLFDGLQPNQFDVMAISQLNYSTLLSTKKINNYAAFYRANYLK
ncbi:MAG: tetratricopeptide repeat protein [Chitinophagales bacterium]